MLAENELFDYSGKSTEWIQTILVRFTNAYTVNPHPTYLKICTSAHFELKKRGVE